MKACGLQKGEGEMPNKVYVDVLAVWSKDGVITPRAVKWVDGRRYTIDRVLDIRQAVALKAGGFGTRYTVSIGKVKSFLYLEETRWFVEARH